MKSFIPGTLSPAYLQALKKNQDSVLASITENPQETAYRAECERKWIESCKPREGYAARNQEQLSSD